MVENMVSFGPFRVDLQRRSLSRDGVRLVDSTEPQWCDDTRTTEIESCRTQINKAWRAALDKLAAAYGRNPADWRWGVHGEATSLYPTMRLFRQPSPQDWNAVLREVEQRLTNYVKSTAPG